MLYEGVVLVAKLVAINFENNRNSVSFSLSELREPVKYEISRNQSFIFLSKILAFQHKKFVVCTSIFIQNVN